MTALLAWVWTPVLLLGVLMGLGLLTDAILRARLAGPLLFPVGLGVAVIIVTVVYRAHASAAVAVPLLVVLALAGVVLGRRDLVERMRPGPAGLAALATYLLYMAPVVLSGHATWAGYNFVNDTAANFVLADLLQHHGAQAPAVDSGTTRIGTYFATSGYPIGSHGLLATIAPLAGAPIHAIYQPVLSVLAALAAISLTDIARRSRLRGFAAAAAAVLAMGGVLLYRYTLHGAIKEIALTALATGSVALAAEAVERRLPIRLVALVAVCCFGMVLVFSAVAGAYALVLGVLVLALVVFSPGRPSTGHILKLVGAALAVAVIALLPSLGATLDFARSASNVFAQSGGASTGFLGHLIRPLPVSEAAGVWLARDYRGSPGPTLDVINTVFVTIAIGLAAAGAVFCAVRRTFVPLVLAATMILPAIVLTGFVSPYADAKFYVALTPAVVFVAAVGVLGLLDHASAGVRLAGIAGTIALAIGVIGSDAFTYRETRLAPTDRVAAMEDVGDRIPGDGLWLVNEWEEYAKFFMRSARVNPAFEAEAPRPVVLRKPAPIFGRWYDLDRERLDYVQSFPGIVLRRSPASSRPPASFRRIYANSYYELWRRDPAVVVREHLPLQGLDRATLEPSCGTVRALGEAARPGERLVAAGRPHAARASPVVGRRPKNWFPRPDVPGTVEPVGPGTLVRSINATGSTERVWLRMTGGRPVTVSIDGGDLGEVQQVNTPGQWLEVGRVNLEPGFHRVELRRGGLGLRPGDSYRGELGPIVLEPVTPSRLVSVAPRDATRLCNRPWDWIELVRDRDD